MSANSAAARYDPAPSPSMTDLIECELARVVVQDPKEQQYIHLRTRGGERSFPIVIGFHEANEIYSKLIGQVHGRPLTHDLLGRVLAATDTHVQKVVVNALRDNTYYANLHLERDGEERVVDCRPSDAIALAVQLRAPIFVAREVLDQVAPE